MRFNLFGYELSVTKIIPFVPVPVKEFKTLENQGENVIMLSDAEIAELEHKLLLQRTMNG